MRGESFAKPLVNREEPIAVLYRRHVHVTPVDADIGASSTPTANQDVDIGTVVTFDTDNNTATVKLQGFITAEAGDEVSLLNDTAIGTTYNGIVADSSAAPTYVIAIDTDTTITTTAAHWDTDPEVRSL